MANSCFRDSWWARSRSSSSCGFITADGSRVCRVCEEMTGKAISQARMGALDHLASRYESKQLLTSLDQLRRSLHTSQVFLSSRGDNQASSSRMISYSSSVTAALSGCDILFLTRKSGASHASFLLLLRPSSPGAVNTSMSNTSLLFLSIIFLVISEIYIVLLGFFVASQRPFFKRLFRDLNWKFLRPLLRTVCFLHLLPNVLTKACV